MSKRLKVTAEDTNPSMVYDVVATIRQYPARNYNEIARILDEPSYNVYKALRYAEDMGYIHGTGGYWRRYGPGGARIWYFDRLAPYPYEYMDGKRHAYKVQRGIRGNPVKYRDKLTGWPDKTIEDPTPRLIEYSTPEPSRWAGFRVRYETVGLFDTLEDAERWIRRDKRRIGTNATAFYYHVRVLVPSCLICKRMGAD